jgi:hypothetical protein
VKIPFPTPKNARRSLCAPLCAAGFAACILASTTFGGTPRLSVASPAGGQRGGEIEVTFSGTALEDARSLMFDQPGFETTILDAQKGNFRAKVKIGPDVRLGEHSFRVITASGISDVRLFYVTPFPMVGEAPKSKDKPNEPQPVALGTTVFGRTPDDAQDKFVVEMKQGQRLSVEVIGVRLQTQSIYDPFLSIAKEDGTPLVEMDDSAFTRQDPVASIIVPADGKYIITVRDSTNTGPGQCQYLLNIGSFARPLAVYPPGGPAGEDLKVKLIGDAAGVIEQTVKLPPKADDRFEIYTDQGQPTPQPNCVRVSYFPNVLEVEPNNDLATATPANLEPPFALNGIIGEKGDVDYFKFQAKKGQPLDVAVYARRLRSPLDSVIDIYDAKGTRIAGNDDSGSADSYLRWAAPADGEFHIAVRDQLGRGGATFTYRVEITPVQPRISAWLPEMTQNQNQDRRAIVVPKGNRYASLIRIKRWDVAGEMQIDPVGLPPGISVNAPLVDKTVDTIPMVFEAAPDAAPAAKTFVLNSKPTEPPKDTKVESSIEHDVDIAENGNQRSYYTIREDNLAVAVTEEVPVKINLVAPKVPLLQNGSLNLKVVAERKNDFKGPINLSLLYSPPGVGNAGVLQIKENENEASLAISANANAIPAKWKVCVVGNADFGKGAVWFSTQLVEIEIAPPFVAGQISRTFVDQGDSTTVTVKLDQKIPFEGKAKLQLLGLPPSTTADEQEITKDDKEAKFTVKADKAAPAGQHKQLFCQFSLIKDGDQMNSAFANGGILRIDKGTVAKIEEPKK